MTIYQPYTYLIGWSKFRKYYYGAEYASISKIANPKNLWTTYFTSSRIVKHFRENHGEPDIIQIRKVFKNEKETREWEFKVIRRLRVDERIDFLNQKIIKGISYTELIKLGLHWTQDPIKNVKFRLEVSKRRKGKDLGDNNVSKRPEVRKKLSEGMFERARNKTHPFQIRIECEYCGYEGTISSVKRHLKKCIPKKMYDNFYATNFPGSDKNIINSVEL